MDIIESTLDAYRPELAVHYAQTVRSVFGKMVEALGPKLRNVSNDWTYARIWRNTLSSIAQRDANGVVSISEAALDAASQAYADAAVAEWGEKIRSKLIALDAVTIHRLDGISFVITGTRNGRPVSIEQRMIINVSSQGKPFNQFPARIYVDGKFTSEKAYKAAAQ